MIFNYTHSDVDIASSAVHEAYYNEDENDLAVVLSSGYAYAYGGVPKSTYLALINSNSPGYYYAKQIKRDFGPGLNLGYVGEESSDFVLVPAPSKTTATLGTPKGLTYAPDAKVDGVVQTATKPVTLEIVEGNNSRTFSVDFVVDGKTRTHTLPAESFGAAEQAVLEIGSMLDLDFDVKAVYVVE